MRKVNLENVQEAGEFQRMPSGGYVCKITNVEDIPIDPQTGKGDYLKIEYDICEGEYKGYYKQMEENLHFWGGRYIRSYKESALPMFKRMCSAIAKSNPGFVFDGGKQNSDEKTLIGKSVGLVLAEEEYIGNDGNKKTRLYVYTEKDVKDIRSGNFKIPAIKKLEGGNNATHPQSDTNGFMTIPDGDDEEVPFN